MKKIKKIIISALAMAMSLAMVSCGSNNIKTENYDSR